MVVGSGAELDIGAWQRNLRVLREALCSHPRVRVVGLATGVQCSKGMTRNIERLALATMGVRGCSRVSQEGNDMNPTQCTQPEQLFAACMHAGGWPKLGWQCQDDVEEVLSCYDDIVLL